jgi:hypothetical protein
VLDDVTVTQVSPVWELKRARPEMSTSQLVAPALRIGRDHISSTVNTLFLAHAGAALPLLLLFTEAGQGFGDVVPREIVASEVVRALIGSIGLVGSVPISTWLAAFVVSGDATPATTTGRAPTTAGVQKPQSEWALSGGERVCVATPRQRTAQNRAIRAGAVWTADLCSPW